MKIERDMDLSQLAEVMGNTATREEAATMCEFLIVGDYADTRDIPQSEWHELLGLVAEGLARNAEMDNDRQQ